MKIVTLCLAICLSAFTVTAQSADLAQIEQQTMSTVDAYLSALISGDTETIMSLLSGNLLRKKLSILSNPNYPSQLKSFYNNADFIINKVKIETDDKVSVNATLVISNEEQLTFTLLLENNSSLNKYTIYDETQEAL